MYLGKKEIFKIPKDWWLYFTVRFNLWNKRINHWLSLCQYHSWHIITSMAVSMMGNYNPLIKEPLTKMSNSVLCNKLPFYFWFLHSKQLWIAWSYLYFFFGGKNEFSVFCTISKKIEWSNGTVIVFSSCVIGFKRGNLSNRSVLCSITVLVSGALHNTQQQCKFIYFNVISTLNFNLICSMKWDISIN